MDTLGLPSDITSTTNISPLIPQSTMSAINTALTIITVISVVFTIIFLVLYIMSVVRKWRVENAILAMHKDLAEIKAQLAAQATPPTPQVVEPVVASPTIESPQDSPAPDSYDREL